MKRSCDVTPTPPNPIVTMRNGNKGNCTEESDKVMQEITAKTPRQDNYRKYRKVSLDSIVENLFLMKFGESPSKPPRVIGIDAEPKTRTTESCASEGDRRNRHGDQGHKVQVGHQVQGQQDQKGQKEVQDKEHRQCDMEMNVMMPAVPEENMNIDQSVPEDDKKVQDAETEEPQAEDRSTDEPRPQYDCVVDDVEEAGTRDQCVDGAGNCDQSPSLEVDHLTQTDHCPKPATEPQPTPRTDPLEQTASRPDPMLSPARERLTTHVTPEADQARDHSPQGPTGTPQSAQFLSTDSPLDPNGSSALPHPPNEPNQLTGAERNPPPTKSAAAESGPRDLGPSLEADQPHCAQEVSVSVELHLNPQGPHPLEETGPIPQHSPPEVSVSVKNLSDVQETHPLDEQIPFHHFHHRKATPIGSAFIRRVPAHRTRCPTSHRKLTPRLRRGRVLFQTLCDHDRSRWNPGLAPSGTVSHNALRPRVHPKNAQSPNAHQPKLTWRLTITLSESVLWTLQNHSLFNKLRRR